MCTLGVCCALWSAVITDRSKVINWPSDGRVHSAFDEHFLVSFFLWPFQIVSFPNPSLCRNQLENPDDNDGDVSPQCNLVTGCWVASCPELDSVDPQLVFHCIALSSSSTSLDARRMKMTKREKCFSDVLWHLVMRPIIRDCCDWYTFKVMRLLQLQSDSPLPPQSPNSHTHCRAQPSSQSSSQPSSHSHFVALSRISYTGSVFLQFLFFRCSLCPALVSMTLRTI